MPEYQYSFEHSLLNYTACATQGAFVTSDARPIGAYFVRLKVFPCGTLDCADCIAAFLDIRPAGRAPKGWHVKVEYSICCVNHDPTNGRERTVRRKDTHTFNHEFADRGWHNLVFFGNVTWHEFASLGWLTSSGGIDFMVTVTGDFSCPQESHLTTDLYAQSLARRLWEKQAFTDLVVVADGGEKIPCHRSVLSTASCVFDRMLKTKMLEATKARIELKHAKAQSVRAFVKYMYVGQIDADDELAELFMLADMYEMPDLLDVCAENLEASLSDENVVEVLRFLRSHREASARAKAYSDAIVRRVSCNKVLLRVVLDHVVISAEGKAELFDKIIEDENLLQTVVEPVFGCILDHI
eukprot:TRINITY_DN39373_c0_g1_i1.p1 TRINITY_DN39373_c0_g1~~TRINITY_DN39373_c0_g1_i1.p1  ORF type:complete len:354 (+),score=49.98 TRINITY_DN39373_c0_g1_i1:53-1114(+)